MKAAPGRVGTIETPRLLLSPAGMDALDEIGSLHADERVWRHRPEGRHASIEYTRSKVVVMERQWSLDGLGYWVARLRGPLTDMPAGSFVGVGGCAVEAGTAWWNLYYRVRPELHGHGLATELSRAAIEAAHAADDERPVIASLVEGNAASKATAERVGLTLQWRDPHSDDPDTARLLYADRTLDEKQLNAIASQA